MPALVIDGTTAMATATLGSERTVSAIQYADTNASIYLCLTNYVASGGDGYPNLGIPVAQCDRPVFEVVSDYLRARTARLGTLFFDRIAADVTYSGITGTSPATLPITLKTRDGSPVVAANYLDGKAWYSYDRGLQPKDRVFESADIGADGTITVTGPPKGASVLRVLVADTTAVQVSAAELYLNTYFSVPSSGPIEAQLVPMTADPVFSRVFPTYRSRLYSWTQIYDATLTVGDPARADQRRAAHYAGGLPYVSG